MFHFWLNTFFVVEEEEACLGGENCSSADIAKNPSTTPVKPDNSETSTTSLPYGSSSGVANGTKNIDHLCYSIKKMNYDNTSYSAEYIVRDGVKYAVPKQTISSSRGQVHDSRQGAGLPYSAVPPRGPFLSRNGSGSTSASMRGSRHGCSPGTVPIVGRDREMMASAHRGGGSVDVKRVVDSFHQRQMSDQLQMQRTRDGRVPNDFSPVNRTPPSHPRSQSRSLVQRQHSEQTPAINRSPWVGRPRYGSEKLEELKWPSRLQSESLLPSNQVSLTCYTPVSTSFASTCAPPQNAPASHSSTQATKKQVYKVLTLQKSELDKANKDTQHRLYSSDFMVSYLLSLSFSA